MTYSPFQRRVLQVAKRYLGVGEATGQNDGPQVSAFQRWFSTAFARSPWCVLFVGFCCHKAAKELETFSQFPRTASSSALFRWYKARGLLLKTPVAGCVAMIRGGKTGHYHTCFVHNVEDGRVLTVEGNFRNRVAWNRRLTSTADYGPIL